VDAPITLGAAGLALWSSIAGKYALRPDEFSTLEDASALTDMIDALEKAWVEDGKPLTTKGSMGQQVTHPLISEIRTHRMARQALLRQLKLPDAGASGSTASTSARKAASARWSHGA
jgi:hypothetical protein